MRQKLRIALSWLAAVTGFVIGLFGLAGVGMTGIPSERFSDWYLHWFGVTGGGVMALCFLIGSITALWNRGRAGLIFLGVMPIAAFCLAYSTSESVDWHADGSGWAAWAPPFTALGLAAVFYLPLFAPLIAWRKRKLSQDCGHRNLGDDCVTHRAGPAGWCRN